MEIWPQICKKSGQVSREILWAEAEMRVLVVEDDASIRETLGMVLESYHHEPILKSSGELALAFLKEDWPDVMLLDLTLQGMSGEEVYHQIQLQFGRVPPTLVISGAYEGAIR